MNYIRDSHLKNYQDHWYFRQETSREVDDHPVLALCLLLSPWQSRAFFPASSRQASRWIYCTTGRLSLIKLCVFGIHFFPSCFCVIWPLRFLKVCSQLLISILVYMSSCLGVQLSSMCMMWYFAVYVSVWHLFFLKEKNAILNWQ